MHKILVLLHRHPAVQEGDLPFPKKAVTDYFSAFGVEIEVSEGGELALPSPEVKQAEGWRAEDWEPDYGALVRKLEEEAGPLPSREKTPPTVHFFLGRLLTKKPAVNGMLLSRWRGVAVVFTQTRYVKESEDNFLQVCIHELGHCLNLIHPARGTYISAMHQAIGRKKMEPSSAWQLAIQESVERRESPELQSLSDSVEAHPLDLQSRSWLSRYPDNAAAVRPWSKKFRRGELPYDTGESNARLTLHPQDSEVQVGDPFAFELSLENTGEQPLPLPARLALECENVLLEVQRPSGRVYFHTSQGLACEDEWRELAPESVRWRAWSLLGGPGHQVFPLPGTYSFRAYIPAARAVSPIVQVRVSERTDGLVIDESLAQAISSEARDLPRTQASQLEAWIESYRLTPTPLVAHAAWLLLRSEAQCAIPRVQLQALASCRVAPRRVRQWAMIHELERESPPTGAALRALLDTRGFCQERDQDLSEALECLRAALHP